MLHCADSGTLALDNTCYIVRTVEPWPCITHVTLCRVWNPNASTLALQVLGSAGFGGKWHLRSYDYWKPLPVGLHVMLQWCRIRLAQPIDVKYSHQVIQLVEGGEGEGLPNTALGGRLFLATYLGKYYIMINAPPCNNKISPVWLQSEHLFNLKYILVPQQTPHHQWDSRFCN